MKTSFYHIVFRLLQIGIALIPATMGVLALLNDAGSFSSTVHSVIQPMIALQGNSPQAWRALPISWAPYVYSAMFIAEFLVAPLALVGIIGMLYHLFKPTILFEKSKRWVYLACLWGIVVWGLGFFEGAGDWFLSWMSTNPALSGIQQGSLMYVSLLFFVFVCLKLSKESNDAL